MQPLDDIFSSPDKENDADEPDDESDEEPMDIDEGKTRLGGGRACACRQPKNEKGHSSPH